MSTTSEFGDQGSESPSSTDGSFAGIASRPVSATPFSPRKRRRSNSDDSLRGRKRYLDGRYNDAYRVLYNDTATAASTRFVADATFQPYDAKIGVSRWSTNEKSMFFAALERLGKDDVPGIARAIGTKSIPETRYFLLLVQEACSQNGTKRRNAKVTLQDIPASLEVGIDCEVRLELAGDALAWYQERFEAKQEQERYGKYWLITPDIAERIEKVLEGSGLGDEHEGEISAGSQDTPAAQIFQNVPEAELLNTSTLLHLSKHYFMNPSPNNPYPWPHWADLISELAAEPSIYYTAFKDLHTLVVSLTRRLVQTTIIQATARIRTQGWRAKKGLSPYVKRRDVLTTVDMLGLSRNSSERWRGVARRCGLRVKKSIRRVGGRGDKRSIEVTWDEVERLLDSTDILAEVPSTDAETAGLTSGTDDDNFRLRAVRGGTPLPTTRRALPADSEDDHSVIPLGEVDDSDSDMYQPSDDQALDTSMLDDALSDANNSRNLSDVELDALEDFDQVASREEERRLWSLLDVAPTAGGEISQLKAETTEPEVKNVIGTPIYNSADDWRSWTQYRAAWEEMHTPVPLSSFLANARSVTPTVLVRSIEQHESDTDLETRQSSGRDGTRVQSRKGSKADLPIRGARAYAAMQERVSTSVDGAAESDAEYADGMETPVQSIEVVDEDEVSVGVSADDAMDLD